MRGKCHPLRRPFCLQIDGDLWQLIWNGIQARGHDTIRVTKVKGHATDAEVQEGKCTEADKQGNDNSDDAATLGKKAHLEGLHDLVTLANARQQAYTKLVAKVQDTIVAVALAEKEIRDKQKIADKVLGIDRTKNQFEL